MAKLNVDRALRKAKSHEQKGETIEALNLYQSILAEYPGNIRAKQGLAKLSQPKTDTSAGENPSDEILHQLIALYNKGEIRAVIQECERLTKEFPQSFLLWNLLGAANNAQGKLEEAIAAYNKALLIKPDYAEARNNMGVALTDQGKPEEAIAAYNEALLSKPNYAEAHYNMGKALTGQGKLDEAIAAYEKALLIKPDYAEVHNSMGNALRGQGKSDEAIAAYNKALLIKPDYGDAHNNMGNALTDQGKSDEAINSYEHAIKISSNFAVAESNLVACLTVFNPQKVVSHPIAKVNQEITKIDIQVADKKIVTNDQIIELFSKFSNVIKSYDLNIETKLSQIYRRNSVDLNCRRHKIIFDQHNVIPKFCFGCYKVQVEPRTILELIKLFIVFNQLKLEENNTRKCMIELRPEISGFYKGLIYCSGLDQANKIKEIIDVAIKDHIDSDLSSKIKRGCSEYPISFPDYQEINNFGPQLMNYNEAWKTIEENHDRKNPIKAKSNIRPSLSGLNLEDVLIIRKWIDYARGIGDPNIYLLGENMVQYPDVYNRAQERLDKYQFIC
jgi:tetratricopeptide (TPR) repeat protein